MSNTIKFNKNGGTRVTFPKSTVFDLPNSDWTICYLIVLDGVGGSDQYVFRTGEFGVANGLIEYLDASSKPQVYTTLTNSYTARAANSLAAGQAYIVAIGRTNNEMRTRLCPVLATEPTDGSAVISNTGISGNDKVGISTALLAPDNLMIGGRNNQDRNFDHSFGRLAIVPRYLSNFELAQLGFGKEITDLPVPGSPGTMTVPQFYARFANKDDLNDVGPAKLAPTTAGTIVTGAAAPFGFTPTQVAPSITGKPAINGKAQVGVAVGVVLAQMSGYPSPTPSYQWAINGVDVQGATGATYTPSLTDTGKSLTVRQIATNGVGTPTNATSDPVVVENTAAGVTLNNFPVEAIYSIMAFTDPAALVPMSGTWTGATKPTKVQYQVYALDGATIKQAWTDAVATINADGSWTAKPAVPLQGIKKVLAAVRTVDSAGVPMALSAVNANRFGVGANIACIGSSSAYSWFTVGSGYTPDNESTSRYNGGWQGFGAAGAASQMAKYLAQQLNMPIGLLDLGNPGDQIATWQNTSSSSWLRFVNAVAAVGTVALALATMGSNDAVNAGWIQSRTVHYGKVKQVVDQTRAMVGNATMPVLWSGFNRRLNALEPDSDWVRMAENDIGDYIVTDANGKKGYVWHVPALDFELGGDGVHLTAAGFKGCCDRMGYVVAQALKRTDGTYPRGPKIESMTFSGSAVTVTVRHRSGTDLAPASGAIGFTVVETDATAAAAGQPVVQSVARRDATHYTITCDRALVKPTVKYMSGKAPDVSAPVFDNGTMALPMHVETDMAVTYLADVDATAPAMSGSASVSNVTFNGATVTFPAATDNVAVAGYEYNLNSGSTWTPTNSTATSFALNSLAASSSYSGLVRAIDTSGNRSNTLAFSFTTSAAPDTTAPTLSNPTATATGQTTATGSVTTNEAGGTLYRLASRNATESAAAVKAGLSSAVTAAGAQAVSFDSLPAGTTLYGHFLHRDAAGNESAVANTAAFTTGAESPATVTNFSPSSSRTLKVLPGRGFSAEGAFWDLSNPDKPVGTMDPSAILDIPLDWTRYLTDIGSPGLFSATFTVTGVQNVSGIRQGNLTILFAQAIPGAVVASITVKIVTATTPQVVDERTIFLKFEDK